MDYTLFVIVFIICWLIGETIYYCIFIKRKRASGTIIVTKDSDTIELHIFEDPQTLYEKRDYVLLEVIRK